MTNEEILSLYADLSIIPVTYAGKRPAFDLLPRVSGSPSWEIFQREKASLQLRRRWLEQRINIAIVTGRVSNNLVVIDFDSSQAYDDWEATWTELTFPTVRTAHGYHVYVTYGQERVPSNAAIALASDPSVQIGDMRGEGGYAVAPPSVHPSGVIYEWIRGGPSWSLMPTIESLEQIGVVHYITQSDDQLSEWRPGVGAEPSDSLAQCILDRAIQRAAVGSRNDRGLWLACQLRDNGFDIVATEAVMRQYQSSVGNRGAPYTLSEALATVRSAYKRPARSPWKTVSDYDSGRRASDFLA